MVFVVKVELKEQCIGNTYTTNYPQSNEGQAPHNPANRQSNYLGRYANSIFKFQHCFTIFTSFNVCQL